MSGQPTRAAWAVPAPAAWPRWARFVRRPELPDRADLGFVGGLKAVSSLFGLDIAIMAALFGALGAAMALGFEMPRHTLGEMKLTPHLIAAIVIGAPIGEEIAFRGWLSGRIGHILGTLFSLPAILAVVLWFAPRPPGAQTLSSELIVGVFAGFTTLALVCVLLLRARPAMGWFQRHFAWFFWASALLFAGIHLTNFASAGAAMLPLVLPQFALALLLGYLRVTRGLWASILLHMLHNATFIALVLAGSSAG